MKQQDTSHLRPAFHFPGLWKTEAFCFRASRQQWGQLRTRSRTNLFTHQISKMTLDQTNSLDHLQRLEDLSNWCESVGIRFNSVTIKSVNGSRGLYATHPINPGDEIIAVPRSSALITNISLDVLPSLTAFRGISTEFWNSEKWEIKLAIQLLDELTRGNQSKFFHYLTNLPSSQNCVLWAFETGGRNCVEKRLRRYNLMGEADTYRAHVKSRYLAFKKALPREIKQLVSLRDFSWALSVVISRSFGLPSDDKIHSSFDTADEHFKPQLKKIHKPIEYALLPGLDMANHSIHCKTSIQYDVSCQEYKVVTGMKFDPGEEVLISYGSKSNDDLLFFYGFVEGLNPADTVKIPNLREWVMDIAKAGEDESLWERKLQLLKDLKLIQADKCYMFRSGTLDEDLMRILRIAVASAEELDMFSAEEVKNPSRKTKTISLKNELSTWAAVARKCEEILDQMPTLTESNLSSLHNFYEKRFCSAAWDWKEDESIGELLYLHGRQKVLQDCVDTVTHYSKVSSSVGRICTVLLPPTQSLIKTDVFTSTLPPADLLGVHKFVLSDGNNNQEG